MPAPAPPFDDFVAARIAALSRTAYLLTGDHHLAEDLVQTTLFKAARAWHRIDGDPEPYVRRILYRENVNAWRGRRRLTEVSSGSPGEYAGRGTFHDAGRETDLRLVLRDALSRLTAKQRTVLVLRYFEDLTEAETAAAMGIGLGTVKSNVRDALARLRTVAPELADLTTAGVAR